MYIHCNKCAKPVSSNVPDNTVVRAWIECVDCIENKTIFEEICAEEDKARKTRTKT